MSQPVFLITLLVIIISNENFSVLSFTSYSNIARKSRWMSRSIVKKYNIIMSCKFELYKSNHSDDYDSDFDDQYGEEVVNKNYKEYFATCIPGLSSILAQELMDIGASNVEISGTSGVKFTSKEISNHDDDDNDDDTHEEEDIGMKALMYIRTAHRIMELITTSSELEQEYKYDHIIHNRDTLYNFIQSSFTPQQLQSLLGNGQGGLLTLHVSSIMNNEKYIPKDLSHSHYSALTVKNALVDKVRELRQDGARPDVDLDDPDVPLMIVIKGTINNENNSRNSNRYQRQRQNNEKSNNTYNGDEKAAQVSLYRILHYGGNSLHKRGYRSSSNAIHKAAMKESLASGLLIQSGWDKLCYASRYKDGLPAVLIDPMCGSGTFCVEAAMIAADYAPGLMRIKCFKNDSYNENNAGMKQRNPHFVPPVVRWKDSNMEYWKKLVLEARDRASSGMQWMRETNEHRKDISNCNLFGNEMNPGAFSLANACVSHSGFDNMISLEQGDCIDWNLENKVIPGRTIIVSNPPWNLRLTEDVEDSWISLKRFLQDQCNESEAWILSGSKSATRHLRMKKTRSMPIKTAGEDLRWIQYHIFKKKETEVF